MTDNEIIKALECCQNFVVIHLCDAIKGKTHDIHLREIVNLINRLKVENERLEKESNQQFEKWKKIADSTKKHYAELYNEAKEVVRSEAIKEFAERLKRDITINNTEDGYLLYSVDYNCLMDDIDNLVKEMVGEDNGN